MSPLWFSFHRFCLNEKPHPWTAWTVYPVVMPPLSLDLHGVCVHDEPCAWLACKSYPFPSCKDDTHFWVSSLRGSLPWVRMDEEPYQWHAWRHGGDIPSSVPTVILVVQLPQGSHVWGATSVAHMAKQPPVQVRPGQNIKFVDSVADIFSASPVTGICCPVQASPSAPPSRPSQTQCRGGLALREEPKAGLPRHCCLTFMTHL